MMMQSQNEEPAPWAARVQVAPGHYGERYNDWDKWLSYYWQISHVTDAKPKNVLAIGVGSGTVCQTRSVGAHALRTKFSCIARDQTRFITMCPDFFATRGVLVCLPCAITDHSSS